MSVLTFLRSRRRPSMPFGEPLRRYRDMELIAGYYRRQLELEELLPGEFLDDRTWSDLEMDAVFEQMDGCASAIGQQVLYHTLRRTDVRATEVQWRSALADVFAEQEALRSAVQRELASLMIPDAYHMYNLFDPALPERPRFSWVFPLLTLAAVAMLGLFSVQPGIALAAFVGIASINSVIQYRIHSRLYAFIAPMTLLHRLVGSADRIVRVVRATRREETTAQRRGSGASSDALDSVAASLAEATRRIRPLARVARYLAFERRPDDFAGAVYTWLNTIFLLDINAYVFSVSRLRRQRAAVRAIYQGLASLDAAIALASWRTQLPAWCKPERLPRSRALDFVGLYHPLIEMPVPNDFSLDGECILITGSNMSGKTTFIRAVGLAAHLAGALDTCPATRFRAPPLVVRSMIGRADDLVHGKSYFGVELELALGLISAKNGVHQQLFVIDEIFRGTNTIERIAASKAVLHNLAAGDHVVLAATHDLELLDLLERGWSFHHFRESVGDGSLAFDYTIRPGPTSTHNAIRMMDVFGYPEDVVADARDTVQRLAK